MKLKDRTTANFEHSEKVVDKSLLNSPPVLQGVLLSVLSYPRHRGFLRRFTKREKIKKNLWDQSSVVSSLQNRHIFVMF